MRRFAVLIGLFAVLGACLPPRPVVVPIHPGDTYPLFSDTASPSSLQEAIRHSLQALSRSDPIEPIPFADQTYDTGDLRTTLSSLLSILEQTDEPQGMRNRIQETFDLYELAEPVLFTGYYEPLVPGSLVRTERFRYPLYSCPEDLPSRERRSCLHIFPWFKKEPAYYSREEIDNGSVLSDRRIELVYLDDPIERFFLHVQGSGSVRLPNESEVRVQYHCSNGRPYTSIGRVLIQERELQLEEASLSGIKEYLKDHPEQRERIMNRNERYIFFRLSDKEPLGVSQIPLTPFRSLATDRDYIPTGSLVYYVIPFPVMDEHGRLSGWEERAGFALSQDVGSAIQGPFRADLYMGKGPAAENLAGNLRSRGKLYVFIKKRARD